MRKTELLRRVVANTFGKEVRIPLYKEEAAFSVALLSTFPSGNCRS